MMTVGRIGFTTCLRRASSSFWPLCTGLDNILAKPSKFFSRGDQKSIVPNYTSSFQCFPPAEMARGDWMKYVEGLCFVENTYFVASNEQIPRSDLEREQREIHYYQWVPFLLAGQALFFLLPKLLWKAFNGHTGLDFGSLLDRCYALDKCGDEEEEARTEIGKQLNRHINFEKEKQNRRNSSSWTLVANNEATLLYLGFKMLNLFVTFGQLYFLNQFFAPDDYDFWGLDALSDLLAGKDWHQSGRFPRVTFCDVPIRQPQPNMPPLRYTFQCLMKTNLYNEKIFILIWLGLAALNLLSCWDFLLWCYQLFCWTSVEKFVLGHLGANSINPMPGDLASFVRHYIGHDGCTILRLVDMNCSPQMTAKIVEQLWEMYCDNKAACVQPSSP